MLRKHKLKTLLLQCYCKCICFKSNMQIIMQNVFQVLLKQDNTTQLVQDDQVKGPLRVCMLYSLKSKIIIDLYRIY